MEEHPQARFIVDTLHNAGFVAYYAGGWVRDYLLNHPSDDIDIATNAPPETIQTLFPHTVPLGIAFGIVLVVIEGHQFEVATFRQDIDYLDGRRPTKVEFSTAEEDAKRRDFTINGMFYDPINDQILDYIEGRIDLEKKLIRAIGNPHERIREDRLRMIRGVRMACRFGFQIEQKTQDAIRSHAKELFPAVAIERIVQELTKGRAFGNLRQMLLGLHEFGLLASIFQEIEALSMDLLVQRLEPIRRYPKEAPLIASLLPLFPSYDLTQQMALCKRLKLSNHELQFTTFLYRLRELVDVDINQSRPIENVEWAYLYSNSFCPACLQIISSHLEIARSAHFLEHHEERMMHLREAIERLSSQDPVVKSGDLLKVGIQPGKTMGQLLSEAERISFNERIYEPAPIIERLKKTTLWPSD
jgi:poly(A) polymerase